MGRVLDWMGRHVELTIGIAGLITFVCACCVVRYTYVHGIDIGFGRLHKEPTPAAQAITEEPARLAVLRKEHTRTTDEALAYLVANAWVDGQEKTVVRLSDACVTESYEGEDTVYGYGVAASARRQEHDESGNGTVWTLSLETATWREIAFLTVFGADAAGTPPKPATFVCPKIAGGATLTLSADLKEVTLVGAEEAIFALCGTTQEEAASTLAHWCAGWRPTATTATWEQAFTADFDERVFELPFALDDTNATHVTLTVSMDDGTLDVREGR